MSVYSGIVGNCSSNYSGSFANTTGDLNLNTVNNCIRTNRTIISPYGFHSVPTNNLSCIHSGPPSMADSVVLGFINPVANSTIPNASSATMTTALTNAKDLAVGESEIFNGTNYALKLGLTGMIAKWQNAQTPLNSINTKIAIGSNTVNLLVEIYSQMLAYIDAMNIYWTEKFDKHTHLVKDVQGGSTNIESQPPDAPYQVEDYVPENNFTNMKSQLDAVAPYAGAIAGSTCYIDDYANIYTIVSN